MIGLPSLNTLDGAPGPRIWLAAEATDMRCGFDQLPMRPIRSGYVELIWKAQPKNPEKAWRQPGCQCLVQSLE